VVPRLGFWASLAHRRRYGVGALPARAA
jgi:hypothetical protein